MLLSFLYQMMAIYRLSTHIWEDKWEASAKATLSGQKQRNIFHIIILFPVLCSVCDFYPGILKVTKHPGEKIHSHPIDLDNGKIGLFWLGVLLGEKSFILIKHLMPLAGKSIHAVHP